jgi:hypothetical protein
VVVDCLVIFKKSPLWPQVLLWKLSFLWFFEITKTSDSLILIFPKPEIGNFTIMEIKKKQNHQLFKKSNNSQHYKIHAINLNYQSHSCFIKPWNTCDQIIT